jgi:hypothetical protein
MCDDCPGCSARAEKTIGRPPEGPADSLLPAWLKLYLRASALSIAKSSVVPQNRILSPTVPYCAPPQASLTRPNTPER